MTKYENKSIFLQFIIVSILFTIAKYMLISMAYQEIDTSVLYKNLEDQWEHVTKTVDEFK